MPHLFEFPVIDYGERFEQARARWKRYHRYRFWFFIAKCVIFIAFVGGCMLWI